MEPSSIIYALEFTHHLHIEADQGCEYTGKQHIAFRVRGPSCKLKGGILEMLATAENSGVGMTKFWCISKSMNVPNGGYNLISAPNIDCRFYIQRPGQWRYRRAFLKMLAVHFLLLHPLSSSCIFYFFSSPFTPRDRLVTNLMQSRAATSTPPVSD